MTDKKLTDSEIVKALECCLKNIICGQCPLCGKRDCMNKLYVNALDLINRLQARVDDLERNDLPRCKDALRRANEIGVELQAENERLEEENEKQYEIARDTIRAEIADGGTSCHWCEDTIRGVAKAEAYKEFAEKTNSIIDSIIEKYSIKDFEELKAICQILRGFKNDTYNLLKESVGDSK
jgi:hypothetical protein